MGDGSRLVRPRTVTGTGEGLCSRAGLWWLATVADQLGLTGGLCQAMRRLSWRDHHPGRTLAVMVLALADGATAMSDMTMLRAMRGLFGPVASTTTLWRTINRVGPAELRDLTIAETAARAVAYGLEPERARVVIDIDATIVTCRSDKQDAAGTWKRTHGFHPLIAADTDRREVLAQLVRPGNAGSSTAIDHVELLAAAIDALPERERAGHDGDSTRDEVACEIVVRTDSGGASHWLAEECVDRNCTFSFGYPITEAVRLAVGASMALDDNPDRDKPRYWQPAVEADGSVRDGAEVADLTDLVDLNAWPNGTRLIVRRERAHPGAQLSLFDDIEGMRHTAHITNHGHSPDTQATAVDQDATATSQRPSAPILELAHRQRGAAEDIIRDLKACGYDNWPSDDIVNNQTWAQLCAMAFNLLSRAQRLTLTGPYTTATPKTIRQRLLHVAGQITPGGRILHLDHTWPWTPTLLAGIQRTNTITRHAA